MKKIILLSLFMACLFVVQAYEKRDLLQKSIDFTNLKSSLIPGQKWVTFPDYKNRIEWDSLTNGLKSEVIAEGESYLNYEWKVITATDYLEVERSGSIQVMAAPFGANNTALGKLVVAELAEGKGRFLDQIINGIWYYCEMTSWGNSASISSFQATKRVIPDPEKPYIDLTAGDLGSYLSWCYYFFKDEMDKVDPIISRRLRDNLQRRILDPYMNNDNWRWLAFNATPTTMVNNWTPWCNFNVLTCFLLLENDADKLAAAVQRTMVSVDKFINYYYEDGACEEGPSYFGHAAGKLYDYLQILSDASSGKVSIFDQPIIKNMGEYIVNSYIGKGWVVNFADAAARGGGEKGLIFRYGKAVNSLPMEHFAAYLYERDYKEIDYFKSRDLYETLENLRTQNELAKTKPQLSEASSIWYPGTEFCYMRNQNGYFLAAKGGYNAESHNHNDVGTFILFFDQTPMIIDIGVGTYSRKTFSSKRYDIWTMQSNNHNLPMVNGVAQENGREYQAKNVRFDKDKSTFSLDIAGAYPKEAAVKKWERSYHLESKDGLIIQDKFSLSETEKPNQLNFMTWSEPDISEPRMVTLVKDGIGMKLTYNPNQFKAVKEAIELSDGKLSRVWGKQVYRLSLDARKMQISGKYKITIQKL